MGKSGAKNARKVDEVAAVKADDAAVVSEAVVADDQIVLAGEEQAKGSTKISYEGTMPLAEAVAYFEAIAKGLKKGALTLRQGAETLTLTPDGPVELEVKASEKKRKGKLAFEITWSAAAPADNFEIS